MEPFRVPASACPECGYVMDAASVADGAPRRPEPGDVTLCIKCAAVAVFDDALHLRKPARSEWRKYSPEIRRELERARRAILKMRAMS